MDEFDPIVDRLRDLGHEPMAPDLAARHLGTMAGVRPRAGRAVKAKVGAAFFAGLLVGGTGLATAGALPAPAQDVAHTTLGSVGLDVPNGHARFTSGCGTDPETGQPFKNHGQYVKAHHGGSAAGQSNCGKPLVAVNGSSGETGSSDDTGPTGATGNDKHDHGPKGATGVSGANAKHAQGDDAQGDEAGPTGASGEVEDTHPTGTSGEAPEVEHESDDGTSSSTGASGSTSGS